MTRLALRISYSFLVNEMQFDPRKLFILCRSDALSRRDLRQLWELIRDGRNHGRNRAETRKHFEAAGGSRWCDQHELGSAQGGPM